MILFVINGHSVGVGKYIFSNIIWKRVGDFSYECVWLKAWHSHSKRVSKGFQYSTFITWVTYRFVNEICGMARGICGVIFPANFSQFFFNSPWLMKCGVTFIQFTVGTSWFMYCCNPSGPFLLAWINLNPIMECNTSLIRCEMKLLINSQICTNTNQIPNCTVVKFGNG